MSFMKRSAFISTFLPLAREAGERFSIHPVVILAQAAIESGWGQSVLSSVHNNYFGITAYGRKNPWWNGTSVRLGENSLLFRTYPDPLSCFTDYCHLIRTAYTAAADASHDPKAFARILSQSKYISEVNGDNREVYRALLVSISRRIRQETGL